MSTAPSDGVLDDGRHQPVGVVGDRRPAPPSVKGTGVASKSSVVGVVVTSGAPWCAVFDGSGRGIGSSGRLAAGRPVRGRGRCRRRIRVAATAWMSRSRRITYSSPWTSTSNRSSGLNSTLSPTLTERTWGPTATASAQVRRRDTWAVAGIRMPARDRRSPSAWPTWTRTRSASTLMASLAGCRRRSGWSPGLPRSWSPRGRLPQGAGRTRSARDRRPVGQAGRTATPAAARCALASATVNSPRWKMDAASTASAAAARRPPRPGGRARPPHPRR